MRGWEKFLPVPPITVRVHRACPFPDEIAKTDGSIIFLAHLLALLRGQMGENYRIAVEYHGNLWGHHYYYFIVEPR